jgi:hypothetical protein
MYSVLNYIKATSSRPRESSRLIKPFQISSNVFKNFTTFADACDANELGKWLTVQWTRIVCLLYVYRMHSKS